jgi:D-tyrosyl-tRNA(Tyr) deacylase
MILVGFTHNDTITDIEYIKKKILSLRIFDDEEGKMNYSIKDINGSLLIVSQFTLYAETKNGNRPSFSKSLKFNEAKILYDKFISSLKEENIEIKTGEFGSDMLVTINNDGPVTIIIDSKEG